MYVQQPAGPHSQLMVWALRPGKNILHFYLFYILIVVFSQLFVFKFDIPNSVKRNFLPVSRR